MNADVTKIIINQIKKMQSENEDEGEIWGSSLSSLGLNQEEIPGLIKIAIDKPNTLNIQFEGMKISQGEYLKLVSKLKSQVYNQLDLKIGDIYIK
ncbi:hypothetical protein [Kriegella aquimaris]|uniref:Uncharacterized protein n=1 Tax=Kriegella aquimaris TaxID=192904 RepID=A0A1G9RDA0_9FLAO|nr:hypothetical protein [Kriegella aquimaris]SDM21289.1 hypothetical protein SAMN04488514_10693 [Kriegella aquimaris]